MDVDNLIRALTISSLAGLLLTVGMRLRVDQVAMALKRSRLVVILVLNFLAVPALTIGAVKLFRIESALATGMLLLAAAPFAPVVPVFARLARADLPLAAGLTTVIPLVSTFLTPFICLVSLRFVPEMNAVQVSPVIVLLTLCGTIILPLGVGVAINHYNAVLGQRILRPIEVVAEAAGALSLIVVTTTQFHSILATHWHELLAMILLFELFLWLGYAVGGASVASSRVVALGTSNRNIALALLVALQSFPGTAVVSAVVTNGFLLILLGLAQVGWWRLVSKKR